MNDFKFKIEDYILYILSKIEPAKSDKIRLNKVAFFVEFAYMFKKQKELSLGNFVQKMLRSVSLKKFPMMKRLFDGFSTKTPWQPKNFLKEFVFLPLTLLSSKSF